jgi:hypothetical protein
MRFLENAKGPVAAGLEERLPCAQVCVVRERIGRVVGREGIGQWRRRYGSLGVVGYLATVYKDLLLQQQDISYNYAV